ncbi:2-methoxy-6-polyprenyl-1,4-benzoquinol methylase, mitochondrial-like [Hydractinia symbiolongicarpus]|uniref:2-methoxy-6-polyprenyl-1,4-benzoquinol methylase, mitochondrial-like n=1 Tax=Hydractinia symbiolongicarpus TaxID=13093 RepID=UPI00254F7BC1|nr:2-methoxy-6-polyprenyl-1,4-benzoquinol methylase, mitochondrial-like [Hydractinia symbiolongicarpus]
MSHSPFRVLKKSIPWLNHLGSRSNVQNKFPQNIGGLCHCNRRQHSNSHSRNIRTFTPLSRDFPRVITSTYKRGYSQNASESVEEWTHFGYEKVKEKQKVNKVYDVFENVATSYDLMNDLMSVGTHRLWKNHFVHQLKLKHGLKILDMAGGTGDIAFKMLDNIIHSSPSTNFEDTNTEIIISDINQAMLDVGKQRAEKLGIEKAFQWKQADAENLPFEDESLDLYTISFGIRNTTHIDKVLDEAFRVLKVGGRFSCLEFSTVQNPLISSFYDSYSFQVIPVLGQVFANDWDSYQYLVESIRQFPDKKAFADMIYDAGFSNVMVEDMTFGVVCIHDGFKI